MLEKLIRFLDKKAQRPGTKDVFWYRFSKIGSYFFVMHSSTIHGNIHTRECQPVKLDDKDE